PVDARRTGSIGRGGRRKDGARRGRQGSAETGRTRPAFLAPRSALIDEPAKKHTGRLTHGLRRARRLLVKTTPRRSGVVMRTCVQIAAAVAVSILLTAPSAHAQGYITPSLGVAFGNLSAEGRANFGLDLGWLSRFEPFGVELNAMYAPSFFGNEGPYGENSVATVMGNIVIAGGGGGRGRFGGRRTLMRPYVSGGVGIMHEVVTTPVVANKISNNDLGLNLGLGLMALTG